MNKLSIKERAQVIKCLVEGSSIRSTVRMTGVAKNTIQKLLLEIGEACLAYSDKALKNLTCQKVQCDEIWAYCYSKEKNVPKQFRGVEGYGDVWTFTAIDADTKLVLSWLMGKRDWKAAMKFMKDVKSRIANRVQLTTDGYKPYFFAVQEAFENEIDYAMLQKRYGKEAGFPGRYSPSICVGADKEVITGNPNLKNISTSYVERQNLTMRMSMRRFTRLTNGFSKKLQNMQASVSLHFMYYNFCRIHQSLRVTPAMAAKVTDHVWEIEELLGLLEVKEKAA